MPTNAKNKPPRSGKRPSSRPGAKTSATKSATLKSPSMTPPPEVLTLAEAAAFLRIPEDALTALASTRQVPGRLLGVEWRFLKAALEDYLRTPFVDRAALLALSGVWKDDPTVEPMLEEIYRRRDAQATGDEE